MSNIEGRSDGPENQLDVPWWKELPPEQTLRVIVEAKVPASADENLSIGEKIAQSLTRNSQAVQGILGYMQDTPDSFSDIDGASIVRMEHIGYLTMTLTPKHCDNLMQSGLVEMIIPDVDVQINSLKQTSTV